jgi:hypothetical protein
LPARLQYAGILADDFIQPVAEKIKESLVGVDYISFPVSETDGVGCGEEMAEKDGKVLKRTEAVLNVSEKNIQFLRGSRQQYLEGRAIQGQDNAAANIVGYRSRHHVPEHALRVWLKYFEKIGFDGAMKRLLQLFFGRNDSEIIIHGNFLPVLHLDKGKSHVDFIMHNGEPIQFFF